MSEYFKICFKGKFLSKEIKQEDRAGQITHSKLQRTAGHPCIFTLSSTVGGEKHQAGLQIVNTHTHTHKETCNQLCDYWLVFQEGSSSLQIRSSLLPGPLYNFSIHNVEPYESRTSCSGFKVMALAERQEPLHHRPFWTSVFLGSFLRWQKVYGKFWCNRAWVWSPWLTLSSLAMWVFFTLNFPADKVIPPNSGVTLPFSREACWAVDGNLPQVIWNIQCVPPIQTPKLTNLQFASRPVLLVW